MESTGALYCFSFEKQHITVFFCFVFLANFKSALFRANLKAALLIFGGGNQATVFLMAERNIALLFT